MNEEDLRKKLREIEIPKELEGKIKESISKSVKGKTKRRKYPLLVAVILSLIIIPLSLKIIFGMNKNLPDIDKENKILPSISTEENFKILSTINPDKQFKNEMSNKEDFSTTNTQLKTVDEMDVVKTDGKLIFSWAPYTLEEKMSKVVIFKGDNPNKPEKINEIKVDGALIGLYLYNKELIIIYGSGSESYLDFYNYEDVNNLKKTKTLNHNGWIRETRLIKDELIILFEKPLEYKENGEPIPTLPYVIENGKKDVKEFDSIKYCPNERLDSYLTITNVDLTNKNSTKSNSFLVNSSTIFASENYLYITSSKDGKNTTILKLDMRGDMGVKAVGEVEGIPLNQFSMDEYKGNLRIATTSNRSEKNPYSTVYILDENLKELGNVSDLGKGEIIHSVRFDEEKAYLVTFKNTDPLYILDLSEVTSPKVKGELKIPGVSKYLHKVDENTIIGFGEERDEQNYEGVKISLFSTETPPKELHKVVIKDIHSSALYNHKEFFYSEKHNLIGFEGVPSRETLVEPRATTYIYRFDREKGFENTLKHESKTLDESRILYIGEGLYIVNGENLYSFNINTFEELGKIETKN